jgi:serine/threonine protein kinase
MPDNPPLIGRRLGHWEILSLLGRGGMGEVYLAEDIRLHRKVAVKVLPAELVSNEVAKKRLLHEAQAAAALDHPNICTVYLERRPGSCCIRLLRVTRRDDRRLKRDRGIRTPD